MLQQQEAQHRRELDTKMRVIEEELSRPVGGAPAYARVLHLAPLLSTSVSLMIDRSGFISQIMISGLQSSLTRSC